MVVLPKSRTRRGERGVSVAIVAVTIFALVGFAALAIDLVTLYVAKAQAQRVADAGALAGAKTLMERGVTADPQDTQGSWGGSCTQATAQARAIANRGRIGRLAPAVVTPCFGSGGACTASCPAPGGTGAGFGVNPQVTVTVQSAPLPLFFAKIWGAGTATVKATGIAEGFNPSGTDTPVAAKCVRPWLLPNIDPNGGPGPIISVAGGQVINNEPTTPGDPEGPVGRSIVLKMGCTGGCGATVNAPTSTAGTPAALSYYPLDLPNPAASGPSCSVGASYHQNITACNPTPIACGSTVNLDVTGAPTNIANNVAAVDCLIGASGPGVANGQDVMDATSYPFEIDAGTTHNGVPSGIQVSTSRSVVTIPVYDSGAGVAPGTTNVTVIGFVEAFVDSVDATGQATIHILNVSGCGATARASSVTPVGLGEGSAVPVRLIHP